MELECKRQSLDSYVLVCETVLPAEETQEYIVPDHCPDISRVLYTGGMAFLREKTCQDGRLELNGVAKLSVLYLPEEGNRIQSLEVSIPFTFRGEGECFDGESCVSRCNCTLLSAQARLLNPRKLLLRIEASCQVAVYQPRTVTWLTQLEAAEQEKLQQKFETKTVDIITYIKEKDFTVNDELYLGPGKEEIRQILSVCSTPLLSDSKLVGNKLMLKGSVQSRCIYLSVSGQVSVWDSEQPFSQVVELSVAEEPVATQVCLQLLGAEYETGEAEFSRSIVQRLILRAQVLVWQRREISFLVDAYSVCRQSSCEMATLTLQQRQPPLQQRETVRELFEVGTEPKSIVSVFLHCDPPYKMQEGSLLTWETTVQIQILYLDSSDTLLSLQKNVAVQCNCQGSETGQWTAQAYCPGEVYCAPGGSGIELSFSVDFTLQELWQQQVSVVQQMQLGEAWESGNRPSVVLRSREETEALWEIAKCYHSTEQEILRANELAEEDPVPVGKLLLIPCGR